MTDGLFNVTDRAVLVTGASSGIGASTARCFASRGAKVALVARRKDRLDELAAELPGSVAIPCDVTDADACRRVVDQAVDTFGRLDVLVNNAGSSTVVPAEKESPQNFASIVDLNLVSVFALTQAAAQHMLPAGRGSVINMASIFGLVGAGQIPHASYSASKGAIVNLTRELGAQWARRGVRVNAIAPAYFATEMTEGLFADENGERWIRRNCPMGRAGQLEELHGALIYLASDASSYVTGTTLPVDGGWTAV